MRHVRNGLLLILALLVQGSWGHSIGVFGIRPDLVLLVLVFVGIQEGQVLATLMGFASGLMLDVYDPQALGVNSLANAVVGFLVGATRVQVVAEEIRVQAVIFFFASLARDTIYFTCIYGTDLLGTFSAVIRIGIPTAVYTTAIGLLVRLAMTVRFDGGIHLDVRRLSR
jgi:rod shape-determining protein MreD